jgi:hypothetical protein
VLTIQDYEIIYKALLDAKLQTIQEANLWNIEPEYQEQINKLESISNKVWKILENREDYGKINTSDQ